MNRSRRSSPRECPNVSRVPSWPFLNEGLVSITTTVLSQNVPDNLIPGVKEFLKTGLQTETRNGSSRRVTYYTVERSNFTRSFSRFLLLSFLLKIVLLSVIEKHCIRTFNVDSENYIRWIIFVQWSRSSVSSSPMTCFRTYGPQWPLVQISRNGVLGVNHRLVSSMDLTKLLTLGKSSYRQILLVSSNPYQL